MTLVIEDKPASDAEVTLILGKLYAGGRLNRIPRHPKHREVVLALMCLGLERRYPYAESEINEFLKGVLVDFHVRADHVTCRRYLVDLGFVKRDLAGTRYFLNYPKLESVLSGQAMRSGKGLLDKVLSDRRSARQRRHSGNSKSD